MGINRGKKFEGEVKNALEACPHISIDRFPDPMAGYMGMRNICDFGVYQYPFQYYFECKSLVGNTLNFEGAITVNQWDGLLEKSAIKGVVAGVLVWFIDHDMTVFVGIEELVKLKAAGHKSLNIKDVKSGLVDYVELGGKKKRIFFTYFGEVFMLDMKCWANAHWLLNKEVGSDG